MFNPIFFASSEDVASKFIRVGGITDATQKSAVRTLVVDLKNAGLWGKLQAIYPFVGGTAQAHKFNLKDPRDADSAFRIVFDGSAVHSNNGVTGGVHNTKYILSTYGLIGNTHLSLYSRTNFQSYLNTNLEASPTIAYTQMITVAGGLFLSDMYNAAGTNARISTANTNNIGYFLASKMPTPRTAIFINGILKTSNTTAIFGNLPTTPLFIGVNSSNCAFATIGFGLTDAEATSLYTIIQTFQTTLGRQI